MADVRKILANVTLTYRIYWINVSAFFTTVIKDFVPNYAHFPPGLRDETNYSKWNYTYCAKHYYNLGYFYYS
jgi:hypothetical protein